MYNVPCPKSNVVCPQCRRLPIHKDRLALLVLDSTGSKDLSSVGLRQIQRGVMMTHQRRAAFAVHVTLQGGTNKQNTS